MPTLTTIHCLNSGSQIKSYLNLPNGPDTNFVIAYDHDNNTVVGSRYGSQTITSISDAKISAVLEAYQESLIGFVFN